MNWGGENTREIHFPVPVGALCAYCGLVASSWDHVRPISWGGTDEPDNMVPACWPCNKRKRDLPAEVFLLSPSERRDWLRSKGWKPVANDRACWTHVATGGMHLWRYALRKAAWGLDADQNIVHVRRRWW